MGINRYLTYTILAILIIFADYRELFSQPGPSGIWPCKPAIENAGSISFVIPPDINNEHSPSEDLKNAVKGWMGYLNPGLKLNEISIPGTHDSGAEAKQNVNISPPELIPFLEYAYTQEWSIQSQLEAGIRYFDIRVREEDGDQIWHIYHGMADFNLTFDEVLADMNTFLDKPENNKEILIIRIQTAESGVNPNYGSTLQYYKANNPRIYQDISNTTIPKLMDFYSGGIHAGKRIYMIDSHNDAITSKMKSSPYYDIIPGEDDLVIPPNTVTIDAKERISKELINDVPNQVALGFWFNTPLSGNGTQYALQNPPGLTPFGVALEINEEIFQYLQEFPGERSVGTITMDYPGEGLIYRIVKSNFQYAVDEDGDGYCSDVDCDDDEDDVFGAPDVPGSGVDSNCDGVYAWYKDLDDDGYGSTVIVFSVNDTPGANQADNDDDCNDSNFLINPSRTDIAGSGIDSNCDGIYLWYEDLDGDGYGSFTIVSSNNSSPDSGESINSTDCNDADPNINPISIDVPGSGIDANCDGLFLWYKDLDEDGYGSMSIVEGTNSSPDSFEASNSHDCNDNNASINPDAVDIPGSGEDANCDGLYTWFEDQDSDSFGTSVTVMSTNSEAGANESTNNEDCDDTNTAINPNGIDLVASGVDSDCDGLYEWYQDLDGDGFGSAVIVLSSNTTPGTDESINKDDCDDSDPSINPGNYDLPGSGLDTNCDGLYIWYEDLDGDGFGSTTTVLSSNSSPISGESANNYDCNDENVLSNPAGTDLTASGIDADCDGLLLWYEDLDGDGFGSSVVISSSNISPGSGESGNNIDCDDQNGDINPESSELPGSGIDSNCDGLYVWYVDSDGDGFGSFGTITSSNNIPGIGESADSSDCDDQDETVNPNGIDEVANGIDSNCDGIYSWYEDLDGDGFGTSKVVTSSNSIPGTNEASNMDDCDDEDPSINPASNDDVASGIDSNCDGLFIWYEDLDNDGYGSPITKLSMNSSPGEGESSNSDDCNDQDALTNPGISDVPGSGLDLNCDGRFLWYEDLDRDGYGSEVIVTSGNESPKFGESAISGDCNDDAEEVNPETIWFLDSDGDGYGDLQEFINQCVQPDGYVLDNTDCDDMNALVNPETIWYFDGDEDGYGDPNNSLARCSQPNRFVLDNTDCNDTDDTIYPGAPPTAESKDNNCDGTVDIAEDIISNISVEQLHEIIAYPNPVKDRLTLQHNANSGVEYVFITNVMGQKTQIPFQMIKESELVLDLKDMTPGQYILTIITYQKKVKNLPILKK